MRKKHDSNNWQRGDEKWFAPVYLRKTDTPEEREFKQNRIANIRERIDKWERKVLLANPTFKQTQNLIKKFGGIIPFSITVGVHPDVITRRWLRGPSWLVSRDETIVYPGHEKYYDGLVPTHYLLKLILSARHYGIVLLPEDIYPDILKPTSRYEGTININTEEMKKWAREIQISNRMARLERLFVSLVSTPD